ncbi:hypothetical protein [Aureimonas phyllosphaerae]|uniref:Uncharacterized protein n=1 Tax=Aureimonas phyllosphaerae TaxID=1166078 RepID=A0A7W6FW76_9HYPH|nr:hypothetical protein [Aureimonas phyllosphaerae]MBB3937906.1 hypothetical protein [Aureimonas phyllosphaerae]MBB3961921.1 hypothetical protein [Aureimonas phyllosphaerae]SFF54707.1 hypothetical protein SAMN05216566_12548 [Aureimonas phyllosphaerae]
MPTFRVHFDTGEVFVVEAESPEDARRKAQNRSEPRLSDRERITSIKLDRTARHQSRRETRLTRFR